MKSYSSIIKENEAFAKEILAKVDAKMSKVALRSRNKLPDGVDAHGVHIDNSEKNPNNWTNGFFGGLCAMLYNHTGNEEYLKTLEANEKLLDRALEEKYDTLHHDVGFMW